MNAALSVPSASNRRSLPLALAFGMLVAGIAQVVLGFGFPALEEPNSPLHLPMVGVNVVQHLLLLGGIYATGVLGIAGAGRSARIGLPVAYLGFLVLCLAEVLTLVSMNVAGPAFGMATLAMTAGLVAAGSGALRTRRLRGLDRFALLSTGVFCPLTLVGVALPGMWLHYLIGFWGLTFIWLAVALLRLLRA